MPIFTWSLLEWVNYLSIKKAISVCLNFMNKNKNLKLLN